LDDQKIVYMYRRLAEIFGYVVGNLENISDWIGKYPILPERAIASTKWGQYLETPDGVDFPIERVELSVACKDGTVKTILRNGMILPIALLCEGGGQPK